MHPEKFLDYNMSHSMFDFLTVFFKKKLNNINCSEKKLSTSKTKIQILWILLQ